MPSSQYKLHVPSGQEGNDNGEMDVDDVSLIVGDLVGVVVVEYETV